MNELDKLPKVLKEIPNVRKLLGYPALVTPISQMVAAQSVNNVVFGKDKLINSQVKDYVYGLYGRPPAPVDIKYTSIALKLGDTSKWASVVFLSSLILKPSAISFKISFCIRFS